MSSVVSLSNHSFTGQAKSSKLLTIIVHILLSETDSYPSWISRRERITIEIFPDLPPWKNVADTAGVEPVTSWSPWGASNWATKAGWAEVQEGLKYVKKWDIQKSDQQAQNPIWKESNLKGKNLLPLAAIFFPFIEIPFQKEDKANLTVDALKVYRFCILALRL